jgi:hypothetical protein
MTTLARPVPTGGIVNHAGHAKAAEATVTETEDEHNLSSG